MVRMLMATGDSEADMERHLGDVDALGADGIHQLWREVEAGCGSGSAAQLLGIDFSNSVIGRIPFTVLADSVHMGHGHFQAVAAHQFSAVGVQQIAELCSAALLGQAADDLVSRHAQRHGAVAGLVMAEVALALFDEQLGTGPAALAKAQHGHPASVGGDLQGGGYRLYEAMLEDCEDTEHILEFLTGIATANSGKYIGRTESGDIVNDTDRYLDIFDYSVAVGLHSQLNSRFAALLYHYRDNYHDEDLRLISSAISGLNEAAVERLNDYMYHMTKDVLIYGYEVAACEDQTCAEKLANAFDRRDVETMKSVEHIEGVAQLMKDMSLHMNYDVELVDSRHMVWPFDTAGGRKNYVMGFAAMRKI